jgi:phosphate transport system substrate-binding protein
MFKKKIATLLASTVLIGSLAVGCGPSSSNDDASKVTVSGSTSVGPAMESIAEKFQEKNKGIAVEIQQVGSSAGIKNAIEGTSQIGMTSRDLKDEEKSSGLKETQIALDGIAIITHKSNEVKDLTMDQIKDIYTGKITNWKQVGGKDAPIVVLSREDGSGTRDGFQDKLEFKSEELIKDAQISDGSGNIKSAVEGNENAIGYISFGYVDDSINKLKVGGVELTTENVKSKKYTMSRPFIVVNKEDAMTEQSTKLIDFILSDEGQKIMQDKGFISIK